MPEATSVTELRVHGIGGPTPEDLLDDPRPHQLTGDDQAGFFVRRWTDAAEEGVPGKVEGYSWRGMNTRSPAKAVWLLLAPFALANLAGFMVRPFKEKWRRELIENLVRAAQLTLTLYLVAWLAIIAVDQFAYQCGARPECFSGRWFSGFFRWEGPLGLSWDLESHPSRRVVVGTAIAVAVLGALWFMARITRCRYESYGVDGDTGSAPANPAATTPLADPEFWGRPKTVRDLLHVHLGAGLALLAGLVAHSTGHLAPGAPAFLDNAAAVVPGVVLGAAFLCLGLWPTAVDRSVAPKHILRWTVGQKQASCWAGWLIIGAGAFMLLVAVVLAWTGIPDGAKALPGQGLARMLPGVRAVYYVAVGSQIPLLLAVAAACAPVRIGVGLAMVGAIVAMRRIGVLPDDTSLWTFLLFAVLVGVVALACLGPVDPRRLVPKEWRPKRWEEGLAAADPYPLAPFLVSVLAYVLFYGLAAGLSIRIADFLGDPVPILDEDHVPILDLTKKVPLYFSGLEGWNALGWCLGLVLVVVTTGLLFFLVVPWLERRRGRLDDLAKPYAGESPGGLQSPTGRRLLSQAEKAVARAQFLTSLYGVLTVAAATAVAVAGGAFLSGYPRKNPAPLSPLTTGVLSVVAAGAVLVVVRSFRTESFRRGLGFVWDLMAFWPRHFHPLAPPIYTERAVPELVAGLARLTASGPVVLSAHSQGSVLACCALYQSEVAVRQETVLVTHGSPLGKLYAEFFPLYFSRKELSALAGDLAPGSRRGWRWKNFHRRTDPIGGPILPEGVATGNGRPRILDVPLPDPATLAPEGDPPRIKGHGHYFSDPGVQAVVWEVRRWARPSRPPRAAPAKGVLAGATRPGRPGR